MAKLIYSLKISIFKSQLVHYYDHEVLDKLLQFSAFVIRVYLKYWYSCQRADYAPINDINLMKDIISYKSLNSAVAARSLEKLLGHLWYLNEVTAAFAFFDERLDVETLRAMILKPKVKGQSEAQMKAKITENDAENANISFFLSKNSINLFTMLSIENGFLEADPRTWLQNKEFLRGLDKVRKISVVNNVAERGVALASECCEMKKSEVEFQRILLTVEKERKTNQF